ncbi:hypothetical protein HMPREF9065_01618 [Aggregatibacter sp. oral taxon 458 str. W10330]|nr:hypothetical protein HMPREF9065_01618 [Aggregatibacter sp. oral taxon 458 str. W10330]
MHLNARPHYALRIIHFVQRVARYGRFLTECDFEFNVACILMHDRITYDTLFISCNELHATGRYLIL